MSILAHKLRAAAGNTGGGSVLQYISSNYTNNTSSDNVTVTAPSGIQDGDLLIAFGFTNDSSTGTPSCSGFTLDADNEYSFVMSKIASSESGNYTFNWTGTSFNVSISLSVYRGASNIAVGSFGGGVSSTATAPSMTATSGGIIAYFGMDGSRTTSSTITDYTRRITTSGSSSQASYDNLSVPSGSTGNKTITWNTGAVNSNIQVNIY